MSYKRRLSFVPALLLSLGSSLFALEFHTVGYKSVGMGGAAVANSSASTAAYNNPAMLAFSQHDVEVSFGAGLSAHDGGMIASMSELNDLGFSDTITRIEEGDTANISLQDRQILIDSGEIIQGMDAQSAQIAPQAALGIQVGHFGTGIFGVGEGAVVGVVDQAHDEYIFHDTGNDLYYDIDGQLRTQQDYEQKSIVYAIDNGDTYAAMYGIVIAEIPIAYGHAFSTDIGTVAIGGSLKIMQGTTFFGKYALDDEEDFTDVMDNSDRSSNKLGVDLGVAFRPAFSKELTIGLTGKDLNSPEFDYVDNPVVTSYKVDPMMRVGAAYEITKELQAAIDLDLTSNDTMMSEVDAQYLGGGLDYHPFDWLSLRGGLMNNLDSSDDAGVIYTAGVGLGLKWLQVDLSGQMSSGDVSVNGEEYPAYAKVNLALISRW